MRLLEASYEATFNDKRIRRPGMNWIKTDKFGQFEIGIGKGDNYYTHLYAFTYSDFISTDWEVEGWEHE